MSTDRRWQVLALPASLLLNVLLIGIISGHLWAGRSLCPPRRGEMPLIPQVHVQALPPDQRSLFRSTIASHRETIRAARMEQRRLKLATEADIAADPFDAAKVTADLAALRDASMAVQVAANTGLVDALGRLSPAARAAIVNDEFKDSPPVEK